MIHAYNIRMKRQNYEEDREILIQNYKISEIVKNLTKI